MIQLIGNFTLARTKSDGNAGLGHVSVLPSFVKESGTLGNTNNEYNGVLIGSSLADEQFPYGKGAGRFPTSSAVLSDISAYRNGYRYEYEKDVSRYENPIDPSEDFYFSFDRGYKFPYHLLERIDEHYKGNENTSLVR